MRRAIAFTIVYLLAAGTSAAQELGMSLSGGYSIPGVSRIFYGSCWVSEGEWPYAQIDFHHTQAGFVVGGDFFVRIEPCDVGIGTIMFSRGGLSGPLLSTMARRRGVKARDFTRSFKAAFAYLRYRATGDSRLVPYLGAGVGICGLRESESREYSNSQKGGFLQVVAGGEARINHRFSRPFAELRVNFASGAPDDDQEPGNVDFATFTIAIGLRLAY